MVAGFNPRPRARGDHNYIEVLNAVLTFQSTPPREGRLQFYVGHLGIQMFQSTPPREGRQWLYSSTNSSTVVSIHAPARGATLTPWGKCRRLRFQSTPPREGRQWRWQFSGQRAGFNPRPRARGDNGAGNSAGRGRVSIHAPARGATYPIRRYQSPSRVSIHAPARGATSLPANCLPNNGVSIHAPARGATTRAANPLA